MNDKAEMINGVTFLTLNGVTKTARAWHRPEVCSWDAFRSRLKRYRKDPDRYTLREVINKKNIREFARTGRKLRRRKAAEMYYAKREFGFNDPVAKAAIFGAAGVDLPKADIEDTPKPRIPNEVARFFSPRLML